MFHLTDVLGLVASSIVLGWLCRARWEELRAVWAERARRRQYVLDERAKQDPMATPMRGAPRVDLLIEPDTVREVRYCLRCGVEWPEPCDGRERR